MCMNVCVNMYLSECVYVCESLCGSMNEESKGGAHSKAGPTLFIRHWVVPVYLITHRCSCPELSILPSSTSRVLIMHPLPLQCFSNPEAGLA